MNDAQFLKKVEQTRKNEQESALESTRKTHKRVKENITLVLSGVIVRKRYRRVTNKIEQRIGFH